MVRSLVEGTNEVLNAFPSKNGITETISPEKTIEGKPKMDAQRKVIVFRSCALVCTGTTDTNKPRAVPSIDLRRSNNAGGIIS